VLCWIPLGHVVFDQIAPLRSDADEVDAREVGAFEVGVAQVASGPIK